MNSKEKHDATEFPWNCYILVLVCISFLSSHPLVLSAVLSLSPFGTRASRTPPPEIEFTLLCDVGQWLLLHVRHS